MITPRVTRLLRAPDLGGARNAVLSALPRGLALRQVAILVPTRSAGEELRRTMEGAMLDAGVQAMLLPDILTRGELYVRLHAKLRHVPPLLTDFEREVLLRLAAEEAQRDGAASPFRLRPGLLAAMLSFYDALRRRGRSVDAFDRTLRARLEPGCESDRGAARLLEQSHFMSATFAGFERRVADSGRIDEHALRSMLLASPGPPRYCHVVVCVADQAADPRGLWPADFDLLARLPGLERVDVVATERILAAGLHERLHDALPGIEEQRCPAGGMRPVLRAPEPPIQSEARLHVVCRDREEELVDAAHWIKERARRGGSGPTSPERTAIVFQRPLPYLYLARYVFDASRIPYQAVDSLPLAAEPFASAIDLLFTVLSEEASRWSIIELLGSAQWMFIDPADPERAISRASVAALDYVLRQAKYLGGWDRLQQFAASTNSALDHRRKRAQPALAAAAAVAAELQPIAAAPSASEQFARLLDFVRRHERQPPEDDPGHERHLRARAALLGALIASRDAHATFDDRPLRLDELLPGIRRWIEGQTFSPRSGRDGVLLLDVTAAAFADVDAARLVGLVDLDWPERTISNIFFPASVLRDLGWPAESDRVTAARARFQDLLWLAREEVSVSTFTLEDDAIVSPSPFLEDLESGGLTIERVGMRPDGRIFAHEALYKRPLAPEALTVAAREWLDVRRARTSPHDPRFHGAIDPRVPEVYAVSRVERYLACPFKYYAGHVLRLDEERDDESGLTAQERGQLLHGVFESFFRAWRERGGTTITTESLDAAVALFAEVAESYLAALPAADRALERTYLLGSAASPGLAERAFAFEIEHGIRVVERFVEYPIEGRFVFEAADGQREIHVRGKADRIDLLADDTFRVVDYKLGRAPKPGRILQLPVYSVCAGQQLKGYRGREWSLGRAGYVAFREKNPFVELGGRSGKLDEALREGQHRFVEAIRGIENGAFPPSPDEPWTCTRCGFPQVCRKDYVGDE